MLGTFHELNEKHQEDDMKLEREMHLSESDNERNRIVGSLKHKEDALLFLLLPPTTYFHEFGGQQLSTSLVSPYMLTETWSS